MAAHSISSQLRIRIFQYSVIPSEVATLVKIKLQGQTILTLGIAQREPQPCRTEGEIKVCMSC